MRSDLISRQAAIDMCRKPCMRNADCSDFEMEIMMLPSIQLEIIHCWECKFGEVDDPCFPDQYFCHHNGCDWNNGDHYCGYAKRREDI